MADTRNDFECSGTICRCLIKLLSFVHKTWEALCRVGIQTTNSHIWYSTHPYHNRRERRTRSSCKTLFGFTTVPTANQIVWYACTFLYVQKSTMVPRVRVPTEEVSDLLANMYIYIYIYLLSRYRTRDSVLVLPVPERERERERESLQLSCVIYSTCVTLPRIFPYINFIQVKVALTSHRGT